MSQSTEQAHRACPRAGTRGQRLRSLMHDRRQMRTPDRARYQAVYGSLPCNPVLCARSSERASATVERVGFIGVFDPETNTDEYDCMIAPLLTRLASGADTGQVQQFLDHEIAGHFGMSLGQLETVAMAERLTAWWRSDSP